MMSQVELVETLRKESTKNRALTDTLYAFAVRERARKVVTLTALLSRMKKEGFNHEKVEYVEVLKLLARLGIGKLDTDSSGRVKGLKDVSVTLQSLGMAALDETARIQARRQRNRYGKLHTDLVKAMNQAGSLDQKPVITVMAPKPDKPAQVTVEPKPATVNHTASVVDPTKKPPRVQPRPDGNAWLVLAVPLKDGTLFKTHVPAGLTKDDAKRIGQALADLVQ